MNLSGKPLLLVVILLLGVPIIILTGFNLYLHTPGIQEQIRSEISSNLGVPVVIRGTHVTFLGGLRLDGILAGTEESSPLLTAESLTIYPRFLNLIRGKVSIKELVLNHPIVRIPVASSSLLFARSMVSQSNNASQNNTLSNSPQATLTQESPVPATSQTDTSAQKSKMVLNSLPHLKIIDADLTLLNVNDTPLAAIHGMTLQGNLSCNGGWNGSFEASQATVGTALIIHELHSPVILSSDSKTISLTNLTAVLGGGKLQGNFILDLPPSAPRYSTTLTLSGAALNQFFADASLGTAASEGNISGDLQLSGIAGSGASMEGKGNLLCTDAVIQPADFLKQIGQILQIDELQLLRVPEGKTSFSIHEGKVAINDFSLRSENLILAAQGPVQSNGDLDLTARLLFNEKMSGRLRGLLGSQMSAAPEPGYSQISFHVAGPLNNPKTDLLERLTGIRFGGDLGGILQGLFGHPSN